MHVIRFIVGSLSLLAVDYMLVLSTKTEYMHAGRYLWHFICYGSPEQLCSYQCTKDVSYRLTPLSSLSLSLSLSLCVCVCVCVYVWRVCDPKNSVLSNNSCSLLPSILNRCQMPMASDGAHCGCVNKRKNTLLKRINFHLQKFYIVHFPTTFTCRHQGTHIWMPKKDIVRMKVTTDAWWLHLSDCGRIQSQKGQDKWNLLIVPQR